MHPRIATLVAICDAEAGARSPRVAKHLAKCEQCRDQLRRIQSEKDALSTGIAKPAQDGSGLARVLWAVAAWQGGRSGLVESELKNRLRWQIETYFGSPAVGMVDRPGIRAEALLGKASEIMEVFLGPNAAEAVRDDVLRGLAGAGQAGEAWR